MGGTESQEGRRVGRDGELGGTGVCSFLTHLIYSCSVQKFCSKSYISEMKETFFSKCI